MFYRLLPAAVGVAVSSNGLRAGADRARGALAIPATLNGDTCTHQSPARPGITQSDLLVINKTELAPLVGADLGVMERDARKMRGDGPFLFTQVTHGVPALHHAWPARLAWRSAARNFTLASH